MSDTNGKSGGPSAAGRLKPLKITVVGDGTVGKTCLLISYVSKVFPIEYVPTVFDNYADTIEVDGVNYSMTLWDTAGQEEYERLRPLSYPGTDCFLLCFALDNRNSLDNVMTKWWPELCHHCPNVPILLIGTKADLRLEPNDGKLIPTSEGRKLKSKLKAAKYLECSAKLSQGLREVFEETIRAVTKHKVSPKKPLFNCCVL